MSALRFALGLSLGLLAATPALADDIEVYVGNNGSAVNPNVLFILDNSGSMTDSFHQAPEDYDPAASYSGPFDSNYIYWSIDGSVPSDAASGARFTVASNQCAGAVTALATHGIYTDRIAAWKLDAGGDTQRNAWETLRLLGAISAGSGTVECAQDFGVHGNGGAGLFPSDGVTGPWSTLETAGINWSRSGANYSLFSAHYLNYKANPPMASRDRLQIARQVVEELARRLSGVNLGLMWFSSLNSTFTRLESTYQGGYVAHAMSAVDVPANRQAFIDALNHSGVPFDTYTPLSETLFEAYQYYSGGAVTFGAQDGISVAASRDPANAANYLSPINFECQQNFNVLMTDGVPTRDNEADDKIHALPNFAAATGRAECVNEHVSHDGQCLDELADLMADENTDMRPDIWPAPESNQQVSTYTIGFHTNQALLEDTARKGGKGDGQRYYTADDTNTLSRAFTRILDEISQAPSSFVAPSVSVNGFSRVSNRDSLYFNLFKPGVGPRWDGNLKKYRLAYNPTTGEFFVTDQTGTANVIDPDTGGFTDTAQSFWSARVDGNELLVGGARNRLPDGLSIDSRNVWTNVDAAQSSVNPRNQLHETNTEVTADLLGLPAAADPATITYRNQLLQWARGVDVRDADGDGDRTDARRAIGDPLHSQPVVVQYGGTEANPDLVVFYTTNDGYLHAINAATGDELFAFIPRDLLRRLPQLYENVGSAQRPYGLDGVITPEIVDVDGDGVIEPTDGDRVRLYFGMRRGGYNYYALDVSNLRQSPSSARLMWTIRGGAGNPAGGSIGFGELGQSWSQPLLRKIKLGNVEKRVLVFAGGYDRHQDDYSSADGMGRAIFIVDADTGERLWAAGNFEGADLRLTDMTHSIPSKLAAFDVSGDGYLDRIYVGDTGGQVWRFDLSASNTGAATLGTGGRIAALSGAEPADQRRFYYPPDVALINDGGSAHLALVMGSGYRAHPLDEVTTDRIYMLRDEHVYTAPSSYVPITESALFDATSNVVGEGAGATQDTAINALRTASGWLLRLEDTGEKAVAPPLIISGVAIIPTFTPTRSADPCDPGSGVGSVYYLNVLNATPVFDFFQTTDGSALTKPDRKLTLETPGIPPATAFIVTEQNGELVNAVLHGKEVGRDPSSNAAVRTYWYER